MLSFFFALMVLPGTDGRVDKTAKEEDKADEQYDTGHATVKSVSFSHTGCLTHKRFLEVCPTLWTVLTLSLNTSDAADEEDSVDLGGRRIIKKKTRTQ